MTKKFYLIPLNWFEDWEERIKNILMKMYIESLSRSLNIKILKVKQNFILN